MKDWFAREEHRPHLMHQLHLRNAIDPQVYKEWLDGRKGIWQRAPRIYICTGLRKLREQLLLWVNDPKTNMPKDENDHLPGAALKYLIAESPEFYGRDWVEDGADEREMEEESNWDGRSFVPR